MSGTVSSDQAADRQPGAAMAAPGWHRGGRRRWEVAAVVVVVVAAAVVAAGSGYHTSAATVMRRSLSSQTQVSATLGFAGSYSVAGQGGGALTWLPAAGRVIREGGVLYRVDNGTPVFLLYGRVPAWRDLAVGLTGADVAQLNRDLVKLGYASSSGLLAADLGLDYFSAGTASALEGLQSDRELPVTGMLPLGQAVEVTGAGGHHLVSVSAGLFDDAAGLVQVSGPGLATGQHVVVPAL